MEVVDQMQGIEPAPVPGLRLRITPGNVHLVLEG
jgi:hypothetical protein